MYGRCMAPKQAKTGRNAELHRATAVLNDLIAGKEHDRRTVAAKWGVSLGTADRDLKAIAKVHGVVAEKQGQRSVYRFEATSMSFSRLRHSSVIAACFGASLSSVFEGTVYENNLHEALDFVVRQSKRRKSFRDVKRKFIFVRRGGERALAERDGELDEILEAILHCKWMTIDYRRFGGEKERLRVAPLSMAIYDHQLYVIAKSTKQPWYAFRFSRIESVDVDNETFKYPPPEEYDPMGIFAERFGIFLSDDHPVEDVEIQLGMRWKNYVTTHRWHPSQRAEENDEGVIVKFRVRTCPELEAWILGFGENARVIAPTSLRERIRERIESMARRVASELPVSSARDVPDQFLLGTN